MSLSAQYHPHSQALKNLNVAPPNEAALADRIRSGDASAVHELVTAQLPVLRKMAANFWSGRVPAQLHGDLISEGILALYQASQKFDPEKGSFAGFYHFRVTNAFDAFMRRVACGAAAIPRGVSVTVDLSTDGTGKTSRRVSFVSLNRGAPDQDGHERPDDETELGAELALSAADFEGRDLDSARKAALATQLRRLPRKQAKVLSARFGLGGKDPMTLAETGKSVGLSCEGVRKVELAALAKLRSILELTAKVGLSDDLRR